MTLSGFVRVQAAGEEVRTTPQYFFDNSCRRNEGNAVVIQYTLTGAGFFREKDKETVVPKGHAMLFTHREKTSYGYPKMAIEPYRQRFLQISAEPMILPIFARLRADFGSVVLFPEQSESDRIFTEIFVRYQKRTFRDRFHEAELLFRLFIVLYREQVQETHTSDPVEFGQHYILNHFRSPLNLKTVVEKCNLSREHFIRQFSLRFGEPPGAMLRRLRLEHAAAMLAATDLPVEDVALASGFVSTNSFGRAYRLKYHHSPRGHL